MGSQVEFNHHKFVLSNADEYALRYMEKHAEQVKLLLSLCMLVESCNTSLFQFPHANINLILKKLTGPASAHISDVKKAFSELDSRGEGKVPLDQFRMLVGALSHGLFNEHEVLTLARHYGDKQYPILSTLVALIQVPAYALSLNNMLSVLLVHHPSHYFLSIGRSA